MGSREEVIRFLKDFIFKLEFWGLHFRIDRANPKNMATLLALELKYADIKGILRELNLEDYSQGPLPDKLYHRGDMWVFGKMVKGKEIYIKIQLGLPDSQTICISFHFSEFKLTYPFKK
jgi:hypothetical protein